MSLISNIQYHAHTNTLNSYETLQRWITGSLDGSIFYEVLLKVSRFGIVQLQMLQYNLPLNQYLNTAGKNLVEKLHSFGECEHLSDLVKRIKTWHNDGTS